MQVLNIYAVYLFFVHTEACNFIKKETLAQVFSSEFCEISKHHFSYRTPVVAASVSYGRKAIQFLCICKRLESG